MLEGNEIELLEQPYFNVLERNDYFYKVQSNNVKTEWILLKTEVPKDPKPIVVYRKKSENGVPFKVESVESTIEQAIIQIKRFDDLIFQQRLDKMKKK